jgi:hypothetical protein
VCGVFGFPNFFPQHVPPPPPAPPHPRYLRSAPVRDGEGVGVEGCHVCQVTEENREEERNDPE